MSHKAERGSLADKESRREGLIVKTAIKSQPEGEYAAAIDSKGWERGDFAHQRDGGIGSI